MPLTVDWSANLSGYRLDRQVGGRARGGGGRRRVVNSNRPLRLTAHRCLRPPVAAQAANYGLAGGAASGGVATAGLGGFVAAGGMA